MHDVWGHERWLQKLVGNRSFIAAPFGYSGLLCSLVAITQIPGAGSLNHRERRRWTTQFDA